MTSILSEEADEAGKRRLRRRVLSLGSAKIAPKRETSDDSAVAWACRPVSSRNAMAETAMLRNSTWQNCRSALRDRPLIAIHRLEEIVIAVDQRIVRQRVLLGHVRCAVQQQPVTRRALGEICRRD